MGGGRVDEKAKMPSKGPFLDLEMIGEGGTHGASWLEGRVWQEMRVTMSNPVECTGQIDERRAKSQKEMCVNYFTSVLLGEVREVATDFF